MRRTRLLLTILIVGALGAVVLIKRSSAAALGSVALTGQLTSAEEGAMEGVLVSAKKTGSTITTTVFTDEKGRYQFPAAMRCVGERVNSILYRDEFGVPRGWCFAILPFCAMLL